MHPVIYDVAVSVDGYIAGPDQDISKFAHAGAVVDDYHARLETYSVAIMGHATYEFGYRFGMTPGQNPYPAMTTIVFSGTVSLPRDAQVSVCRNRVTDVVPDLKSNARGPIYLCGGGAFAASLLSAGLIDRLRLKRAPILLGSGTPLFEHVPERVSLTLLSEKTYGDGTLFQEYAVAN